MSLFTHYDHTSLPLGADGTPIEFYQNLRDEAFENKTPIGWSEELGGFWVVAGREEAQTIYRDVENFSSRQSSFPLYETATKQRLMLAEIDPPDHQRYRSLAQSAFSPQNVRTLKQQMHHVVDQLFDSVEGAPTIDVRASLGTRLPAAVTALMLGVPAEDGSIYRSWVDAMADSHLHPEESEKILSGMKPYFDKLIADKRRNPDGQIMSDLVHARLDGDALSDRELLDFFSILLIGGLDNTALLLANIVWHLANDDRLRERLAAERDLIPSSIEEFLRFYSPGKPARVVQRRVEVGGVTMLPGQILHFALPIINRDPREFENPDQFIADRFPNRHLALGSGIHRCLGMHLLRLELSVALEALLDRIPAFRVHPNRRVEWSCGHVEGITGLSIVVEQSEAASYA
jgi:cytochrome P450